MGPIFFLVIYLTCIALIGVGLDQINALLSWLFDAKRTPVETRMVRNLVLVHMSLVVGGLILLMVTIYFDFFAK